VQRHLSLEAEADRTPLAERPAEEATGDRPEEDGEVAGAAGRDQVVGQESRDAAERCADDRAADGPVEDDGGRLPEKVLRVLLDDALVQIGHASLFSSAGRPRFLSLLNEPFIDSHLTPKQFGHSGSRKPREPGESPVRTHAFLRRALPVGAALAIGAGAGAAIYAGSSGGSHQAATVIASVPAQPAAVTSTTLTQLYKNVAPGVVDIVVNTSSGGGFGDQGAQAEGSGFEIDNSGDIVTNQHVVDGATSIKVTFQDGKTAKATLVGTDPSTDIAVIKVSVPSSQLHPLTFASSADVQVGQSVAAIGSPFGLPETLTSGIISALDRTISAPNNFSISGAIQTDAPINHGNSGGPLLNSSGEVIGVNAQIESDSGGNDGVGFAIPSDAVKSVANTIVAGGTVQHAYLGITISTPTSGTGAQVTAVKAGTPAAKAGLKAGDVITAVDGTSVASSDDLTAKVSAHQPGDKVTLTITRNGSSQKLDVTLGTHP
jgi:putative serine protease PepD